ncbi:unnamed protein product [Cladocopium goreaui]|uniref:PUB domain-containing protein n=1 Tax=Cladocopium goreaui TaxID=2562237 RepID=A0A9P1DHQ3_9DINO|nr:unnamed protein product [Cladocopium goreaui]
MAASADGYAPGINPDLVKEAMEAVAAVAAESSTAPEVPEDLELRKRLDAFTEEHGKDSVRQELGNAAKILQRLSEDIFNVKLHAMRREVLERTVGESLFFTFEEAGFQERKGENGAVLQWVGPDGAQRLKAVLHEVQRAAAEYPLSGAEDLCLDPSTMSFEQVSQMVAKGRFLPGILEVNDKVEEPVAAKESQLERPKKPWEK